jgi:hypothetical protein
VPALARLGLLILAAGLFADTIYHSLPDLSAPLLGADGLRAHLVVFVGMLLVLSGVLLQALSGHAHHLKEVKTDGHAYR